MSPLVFSFVPRSHELYGCAKKQLAPVASSIGCQLRFSGPLSMVMVRRTCCGRSANRFSITARVAAPLLSLSFVMNTSPVFRSTSVLMPGAWSQDSTVSLSQSPTRVLRSTTAGRTSMEGPCGFRTLWHRRAPCGTRRLRLRRRQWRRSSHPAVPVSVHLRVDELVNGFVGDCLTQLALDDARNLFR